MVPDPRLAATAMRLSRATRWDPAGELALRFDAGHPQGMVRSGDLWWITTVDLTTQRGFVLAVDGTGDLARRIPVGDDIRFHPGGMDHDGEFLWLASSEYRPRSTAIVERLALAVDARPEAMFRVDDHVGAIVRLGGHGDLVGWTWGSRRFLRWRIDGTLVGEARNPSHFVDHQDGQWLGDDLILTAGVATVALSTGRGSIGGLGVLQATGLGMVREAPFPHYSVRTGRAATQNPIFTEVVDDSMVVHLLPDDGAGTILSYSTPLVVAQK